MSYPIMNLGGCAIHSRKDTQHSLCCLIGLVGGLPSRLALQLQMPWLGDIPSCWPHLSTHHLDRTHAMQIAEVVFVRAIPIQLYLSLLYLLRFCSLWKSCSSGPEMQRTPGALWRVACLLWEILKRLKRLVILARRTGDVAVLNDYSFQWLPCSTQDALQASLATSAVQYPLLTARAVWGGVLVGAGMA